MAVIAWILFGLAALTFTGAWHDKHDPRTIFGGTSALALLAIFLLLAARLG